MFTDRLKRKVYQNHHLVGGSNKKVFSSNVSKSGEFQSFHLITGIKLTDSLMQSYSPDNKILSY